MKANTLFGFALGVVLYVVLHRVVEIESLLIEVGIVVAVAIAIYAGSNILERDKDRES
jgi:hypothetical protein